jgi:hypothetical protein
VPGDWARKTSDILHGGLRKDRFPKETEVEALSSDLDTIRRLASWKNGESLSRVCLSADREKQIC